MASADEIRGELARLAEARRLADEMHEAATAQLGRALRDAQAHPEVSMVEAATLAGLSRAAVYKLLEKEPR